MRREPIKTKTTYLLTTTFFVILSTLFTLIQAPVSYAKEPQKVVIVPFAMHAERDISFLRDGILDMLGSRLYSKDKLVVIEEGLVKKAMGNYQGPINLAYVSGLAAKLGADYALFGSLTVFGESISLDATLVSLKKEKPPAIVFFQSKDRESLMPEINKFAQKVCAEIFGEVYAERESRLSPSMPKIRESQQGDFKGASFWKSKPLEIRIQGMAISDVDDDKENEVVLISSKDVFIYRKDDGSLKRVGEIKGKVYYNFIGVDVADINRNGKSEIFITDLRRDSGRLKSFVLEWDGERFRKIADNENWYYRVLHVPGRDNILLGQERGPYDIFKGGVYELKWSNGRYTPERRQILPKWLNIYGFTYGDVLHNGQEMIVAFTQNDRIRIMDREGNEVWTSIERFGGSEIYLNLPSETVPSEGRSGDREEMERLYLAQRIHIADLDNDGRIEVIVVKNKDFTRRLFSRLRLFKSGHVEYLTWDSLGLSVKWKTQEISGYISDYAIADLNNDGEDELVFSVVAKTGSVLGKAKSFIVSGR